MFAARENASGHHQRLSDTRWFLFQILESTCCNYLMRNCLCSGVARLPSDVGRAQLRWCQGDAHSHENDMVARYYSLQQVGLFALTFTKLVMHVLIPPYKNVKVVSPQPPTKST